MNIEWLKNKAKEKFYPITHAKAVLFGENNRTVNDEIDELKKQLNSSNSIKVFNYNLQTSSLATSRDHEIHLTLPDGTILAVIPQGYTATMDWNTIVHIRYYDMDRHVLCIKIESGIEQSYIFHYTVLYK